MLAVIDIVTRLATVDRRLDRVTSKINAITYKDTSEEDEEDDPAAAAAAALLEAGKDSNTEPAQSAVSTQRE